MKKYLLFLLLLILIIITGCITPRPPGDGGNYPSTGSPNGIRINFLPDLPPSNIREGNSLTAELELVNYAACDIKGKLWLDDVVDDSQGGISNSLDKEFGLSGAKAKQNPEKITLRFSRNENLKPYTNLPFSYLDVTLLATAVYDCSISAAPKICVKSVENTESCPIRETITGSSLNAMVGPVTVTKVERSYNPEAGGSANLYVDITFSKMSEGRVASSLELQNPFTSSALNEEDLVSIEVSFGGTPLICKDKGDYFKENKLLFKPEFRERIINCEALITSVNELTAQPLLIEMDYIYRITQPKEIRINK